MTDVSSSWVSEARDLRRDIFTAKEHRDSILTICRELEACLYFCDDCPTEETNS